MKKSLSLFLAILMLLSFTACGKSEAAKVVDAQIAAIGEVSLDSEPQITAAEAAAAALPEEDYKQLDKLKTLEQARASYEALAAQAEAARVDEAIDAIGDVTLDSSGAVASARSLYDGSRTEVQALVQNLPVLEAAEETLRGLLVEQASSLISAIGDVTMESAEQIQAAQEAFSALSPEDAAKVQNAGVLQNAADRLAVLKKELAESLLANMRLEEDRVRGLKFYYPSALSFYSDGSWAADVRCFVLPYLGQEGDTVWLRLLCNYTADDWVFFKNMTFAVDDARYYKSFNYFDIVHDNGGGDVWEYIDTEVSDSDVEMLWAIVDSTETIIRFEGDDYVFDFTVSDTDKQSIRDVLTVYEALK